MAEDKVTDDEILSRARSYVAAEPEPKFRDEVSGLLRQSALAELRERFSTTLAFGTGGLRGVIGGGGNRINVLAVRRTTQGVADYLRREAPEKLKVVIAFDSRHYSSRFALEAALVLAANGIQALLFDSLAPTPVLSFMVRHLEAGAGIVITASHNPPAYNGYKVFWSDGAQIVGRTDEGITGAIERVADRIRTMDEGQAVQKGLLVRLGAESLEPYYDMVLRVLPRSAELASRRRDLSLVYTPLHGAGFVPVTELLRRLGYEFATVPAQDKPDGDFTQAPVPNPEFPAAFSLAFRAAEKARADLVLATDPDADRLGAAVPDAEGWRIFTGNELGVLLLDYLLETLAEQKRLPAKSYIVKTIVTSELQRRIASAHGVLCLDTLTGFKHICGRIREMEAERPDHVFLLGNEESCGYLIENEVRDKDGVSAAALAAEMALCYKTRGKALGGRLEEIYARYGLFRETQLSKAFPGSAGAGKIERLMRALRKDPFPLSGGGRAALLKDYQSGTTKDFRTGNVARDLGLGPSDVLQVMLEDGTLLTARPSGTEPKIKFYVSLHIDPPFEAPAAEAELEARSGAIGARLEEFVERNAR